jgi:bacillithiol system protein YtxJ
MIEIDELTSVGELEKAMTDSSKKAQLIFKHSLTCPISSRAFDALNRHLQESASPEVDYRLIIVQHARDVSNTAAQLLNIKHETPQAILVRDGRVVWNASHFNITRDSLAEAVKAK